MYNEEERNFIETIHCNSGDCLIFAIDMDIYHEEEVNIMLNKLQAQMPEIKIGIIPSDLVDYMVHIKNNNIPYLGNTIATTDLDNINFCTSTSKKTDYYTDKDLDAGFYRME